MSTQHLVDFLYISHSFSGLGFKPEHRPIINEMLTQVSDLDHQEFVTTLQSVVGKNSCASLAFYKQLRALSESLTEENINIPLNPSSEVLNFFQTETPEIVMLTKFVEPGSTNNSKTKYLVSLFLFALYELNEYEAFLSTL